MKTEKPKYIANLVALRKAAKLTQKQLAQLMGLSVRRIEQLERGKHRLLIDTARDYAAACEYQMELRYKPIK
jgi:transcriptional regulator with XRE-family HTH domain